MITYLSSWLTGLFGRKRSRKKKRDVALSGELKQLGASAQSITYLRTEMYDHGSQAAKDAGDVRENLATLQSLKEHANASAKECVGLPYAPATNAHDRLREDRYNEDCRKEDEVEHRVRETEEERRQRRDALAEVSKPKQRVAIPWTMIIVGAGAIAFILAMTIRDRIFGQVSDSRQAWFMSFFVTFPLSFFVAYMFLGTFKSTKRGKTYSLNRSLKPRRLC